MNRRFNFAVFALLALAAVATACGGAQRSGQGATCPSYRAELDDAAQTRWAQCAEEGRYDVADCRRALSDVRSLTPDAVAAAQRCVLTLGERSDGQVAAETLNTLVADEQRGYSAVVGLDRAFSEERHAGSFSSVITRRGENLIADHLSALSPPTRLALVRTAFRWGLDDLASRGLHYIEDREALADVLAPYARQLDPRAPADETQRFALVVSGEWGADDVLYCYEGRTHACQQWTGTSPLSLLPLTTDRRTSSAVGRAAEQLSTAHEDPEAVAGVTQFLSQPESPNGQRILEAMVRSIASPDVDEAYRRSLANATTAAMCSTENLPIHAARAGTGAADEAATEPWSVFIANCNRQWWQAEDRLRAIAMGGLLKVSSTVSADITASLHSELADTTCEQKAALIDRVRTWRPSLVPNAGQLLVEIAGAHPECAPDLRSEIRALATDSGAHPEARLRAIAYLAENGDPSLCSNIQRATIWDAEATGVPLGRRVESLRAAAERACRTR